MARPQDAVIIVALETQQRELEVVLRRLESAGHHLVPGPAGFWRGSARHAYDAAMDGLSRSVDAGIAAVRSARNHTAATVASLVHRV
jgi:hypothetical protein